MTAEERQAVRSYLNGRDKLIFDLLLETGFRLDDILMLRTWQIGKPEITLYEHKTGKRRTKSVSPKLQSALLHSKKQKHKHNFSFFFSSYHVDALRQSRTTFYRHFEKAVHKAKLDGMGFTAHSLRKCYAVSLIKAGFSLESVRDDLNHTSKQTTLIYAYSDLLRGA